jgi:hypothetical protein
MNYGIGSFAVKEVGCLRNTITNLCWDATSKSLWSLLRTFTFYFICLILFFPGDIFFHVNPTFSALDETVKEVPNKLYTPVNSLIDNEGHFFHSFSDLTVAHEKTEALLPILAIACLGLNSSTCLVNKQLLQTVFGTAFFQSCQVFELPHLLLNLWPELLYPPSNGPPAWEMTNGSAYSIRGGVY